MSNGRQKLLKILMAPRPGKLQGYQKQARQGLMPKRWNILRGDTVQVVDRRHPERGKQGKVLDVDREKLAVLIENVNMHEEEIEADPERGTKASKEMRERPVHYSNVHLVDPVTGFPTKIAYSYLNGEKVRISKRSGAVIPKPPPPSKPIDPIPSEDSDTMDDGEVWAATYVERTNKWEDMREELVKKLEEREGSRI